MSRHRPPQTPQRAATLAVCMIVKNEETRLPLILEDIRVFADEVVIVDTGSTDGTAKIAQERGCRVLSREWTGDFSAARNRSIEGVASRWILWVDADDRIEAKEAKRLRSLKATLRSDCVYSLEVVNLTPEGRLSPFLQTRLFPNDPRLRFENRVHESITSSAKRCGFKTLPLPVKVVHTGYVTPGEARLKMERNRVILEEELERNPDAISIRFLYANTLVHAGRLAESLEHYERITKTPEARQTQCDVYHGALAALADNHFRLSHYREARDWGERAAQDRPRSIQGWYQLGRALFALDDYEPALKAIDRALRCPAEVSSVQVDHAAIRLGCIEMATYILISLNRHGEAETLLKKALQEAAAEPRVYDLLGQLYELQQKNDLALEIFRQARAKYPEAAYFRDKAAQCAEPREPSPGGAACITGTAAGATGAASAAAEAETARGSVPNEVGLLQEAEGLLTGQAYAEAGRLYVRVLESNPRSFEAFSGLGLVAWYLGKHAEAYNLFLKAVEINPEDEDLLLNLWDAARETGQSKEARAILAEAASRNPGLTRIRNL